MAANAAVLADLVRHLAPIQNLVHAEEALHPFHDHAAGVDAAGGAAGAAARYRGRSCHVGAVGARAVVRAGDV